VRFLAADALHGRMTGTPDADAAARYLADVLQREGVAPAGDEHTFLQAVPLERTHATALPELAFKTSSGETVDAVAGQDFDLPVPVADAKDLRFIVVASESDLPAAADKRVALFIDASTSKRNDWLQKRGLSGGEGFGLIAVPGSTTAREKDELPSLSPTLSRQGSGARRKIVRLHGSLLERARARDLASVSVASHVEVEHVTSYNVIGRIAGAGTSAHPELAAQAVVLSAHYDHLGEVHERAHAHVESGATPGPSGDGAGEREGAAAAAEDHIYNGADDDASGCAAVLELAGAFAAAKPARTLVFLLATGEEVGLLGTSHYLEHPAEPLDRTVANLNFEMIGRPDPKSGGAGAMWLTGYERGNELTNLGSAFEAAGLAVHVDPRPEQHFFQRSDNYAFVLKGVVGQTFSTFNLHTDYHHVTDEADRLDYAHMESCVRAAYGAVKLVADGTLTPSWIEGKRPSSRR
jgi:hypothetical protein